jgi:ZIP family zinc transporter
MRLVWLSAAAGVLGTGLGGLIAAVLLKRSSARMTCWMLSFAAGIMTSVVCFGLMPESVELAGMTVSIAGLAAGIAVIMLLNGFVDHLTRGQDDDPHIHHTHEELYHQKQMIQTNAHLLRSGVIMLIAIGLHNIPEGIAIGAGGSHDYQVGWMIALIIAVHNVPEGMAVATPLLSGRMRKGKTVLLTALAGAPTVLGGVIGVLVGHVSDLAVALSLSAAGGAMLYVVFGEIIPQSVILVKSRSAPLMTLLGIIAGLVITKV